MAYQEGSQSLGKDILAEKLESIHFELLGFGHWKQENTGYLKNDILTNYKLVCITQGTCKVSAHNTEYFLGAGDSIIIAPFMIYTAVCTGEVPVEYYDFHFQIPSPQSHSVFTELFHCEQLSLFPGSISKRAIPLLKLSYLNMNSEGSGTYFAVKLSFLRTVLSLLVSQADFRQTVPISHHSPGKEQIVSRCTKYLTLNRQRSVSVEELCSVMHVSQSYLYQSFISVTGLSTKAFITGYKLKLIEVELLHTEKSIRSIGESFGFSSVYAFSSHFKKHLGISPLHYRNKKDL